MNASNLPDEVRVPLAVAWIGRLARERLGLESGGKGHVTATGVDSYTFRDPAEPDARQFVVTVAPPYAALTLESCAGVQDDEIRAIVADAEGRAASGDLGGTLVYRTHLMTSATKLGPRAFVHFQRELGDRVRIGGLRRLSDVVLLDFTESPDQDPGAVLFGQATTMEATFFVPGPAPSDLATRTAAGLAEITASICAFAMGRVIEVAPMVMPAPDAERQVAESRRYDQTILELARDGIALTPFRGDLDLLVRLRGVFLAYHAALQQSSSDVATMLFVIAIEALIAPRASWGKDRVTKRFVESLVELCPATVDALLATPGVEAALGYRRRGGLPRQRKQLLEQMYELRSLTSHAGPGLSGQALISAMTEPGSARVALASRLALAAIIAFMDAPRSSLVGHPGIDPAGPAGTA